jgi:hypothetical protein
MFSKYEPVEAYQLQPGILIMPKYTADGQVCEIGLEGRQYSPELIRVGSRLSHEEVERYVDELVSSDERGPKTPMFGTINETTISGGRLKGKNFSPASSETGTVQTIESYENVTVTIYGDASEKCNLGSVAVTIKWNNRRCQ